jgi:hypothetical protein
MKNEEQFVSSMGEQPALAERGPATGSALGDEGKYLPYPRAIALLSTRLGATPAELAAWVYLGPEFGGLSAYRNSHNGSYHRFFYAEYPDVSVLDYFVPLYSCWFLAEEIETFTPERFITGQLLIARWSPFVPDARFYIAGKIRESKLFGFHPIAGLTEISSSSRVSVPKLEVCLFAISEIEKIEVSDFERNLSQRKKAPGHLNYDPEMQKRANEIAAELKTVLPRAVKLEDVAKQLASELGMSPETVLRRIRKQWK